MKTTLTLREPEETLVIKDSEDKVLPSDHGAGIVWLEDGIAVMIPMWRVVRVESDLEGKPIR